MAGGEGGVKVQIGDHFFASKRDAAEHVRSILYGYRPGETVSSEHAVFLADLLDAHPDRAAKFGPGVMSFQVEWNMGTPGFWLTRVDGTRTDFSYIKCLTPPTELARVKAAFRTEVRDQVTNFKFRAFEACPSPACPFTGERLSFGRCHVDHDPPFDELLATFAGLNGLELQHVQLGPSVDGGMWIRLADRRLAGLWHAYHRDNAGLRVVSIRANLSILRTRDRRQS